MKGEILKISNGVGKRAGHMIFNILITLIFVHSALFAFNAPADANSGLDLLDMSIEELMDVSIISATLREEDLFDAPAPMYVMTAREIHERGYKTLKDIMNDIPGYLDVSDSNENIAGVRGAFASTTNKILILINGHRMNSLSLGRYNTDQYLGVDAIEQVEFIMGPGSVLYGTGALVGVVNVITKQGADVEGVLVRGSFGTFHNDGSVSWGVQSGDIDVYTNFTYLDGPGAEISQPAAWDVVPEGQTQAAGNVYWNRYPHNWSALMSVRYKDTTLHLRRGHYFRATPRVPNGSFYDFDQEESLGFPPGYQQDDFFVDISKVITFSDGSKLTINPSYHFINLKEQSWISQYGANRLPPLGSRSGQNSEEVHWQLKSFYERDLAENLIGMVGVDFLYTDFQKADGIVLRDGDDFNIIPSRYDLDQWPLSGIFGQLVWQPYDSLTVTAGLRYDDFGDQADPRLTPRIAMVYQPTDHWNIKLLYSESYLSPQWEHKRMNSQQFAFVSNPDLEPEEMRSVDAIMQYRRQNVSAWIDVFFNNIDGLITPNNTGTGDQTYINTGRSRYWGMETGIRYNLNQQVDLSGSYSMVDDICKTDCMFLQNDEILNVPQNIFRYGIRYKPYSRLTFNLWGRSYTRVQVNDPITGRDSIDPWTHLDFTALYDLNVFEIRARIINLLDDEYEVGGTVVRPLARYGRGFELSAMFPFR